MQDTTYQEDRDKLISEIRHDIEMGSNAAQSVNADSKLGSEDWVSIEEGIHEALKHLKGAMQSIDKLMELDEK